MANGYKLFWSEKALSDVQEILDFLSLHYTTREVRAFVRKLDKRINLISQSPKVFPVSTKKTIRKSVLTRHTVIYYKVDRDSIYIITLFATRKNPHKLKL